MSTKKEAFDHRYCMVGSHLADYLINNTDRNSGHKMEKSIRKS